MVVAESHADEAEAMDYQPLIAGYSMLKFGKTGDAHERTFKLSGNLRYLYWKSNLLSYKFGKNNVIDFERVVRIQKGQHTLNFERQKSHYQKSANQSLSIIYTPINEGGVEKSLDIVVSNPLDFEYICNVFVSVHNRAILSNSNKSQDELYIKKMWEKADYDKSGSLTFREVSNLLASMNVSLSPATVQKFFREVDDGSGELDVDEFQTLMNRLRARPEIEYLWFAIVNDCMIPFASIGRLLNHTDFQSVRKLNVTVGQLIKFYKEYQNEELTVEQMHNRLSTALKRPFPARQNNGIDSDSDLVSYFMWVELITNDEVNDAFRSSKKKVYQDMSHPLSHYYIASSHNTYLSGDQLRSHSVVQRYIDDLLQGCRCVEIDCWDGDDGLPFVYHGHTMTSKLRFKDVIEAIKQEGFRTSPYPIILSLENHCSLTQQENMAKLLVATLGDLLALPTLSASDMLPSPEELKHKILIKGKRSDHLDDDEEADDDTMIVEDEPALSSSGTSSPLPLPLPLEAVSQPVSQKKAGVFELIRSKSADPGSSVVKSLHNISLFGMERSLSASSSTSISSKPLFPDGAKLLDVGDIPLGELLASSSDDNEDRNTSLSASSRSESTSKDQTSQVHSQMKMVGVHPALSNITYLCANKMHHFDAATYALPADHMCSYSEGKTLKNLKKEHTTMGWINHNKKHCSRIYPSGARVQSSNYMPTHAWSAGSQMVALNYQTHDLPYRVNYGKFRDNGSCGLVLKPQYMLIDTNETEIVRLNPITVSVHVISASQLPKPKGARTGEVIDPFVVVTVNGTLSDDSSKRTHTINDNGFNPVWDKVLEFQIASPELAIITFDVLDEDVSRNEFIAFASIPLTCIEDGYRSIELRSASGKRDGDFCFATLFVRIQMRYT